MERSHPRCNRRIDARAAGMLCIGALLMLFSPQRAQPQSATPAEERAPAQRDSRAELESLAAASEEAAAAPSTNDRVREQKRAEAAMLRARLREGDFQTGDRIVLVVRGDSALTDTFIVRPTLTLSLPNIPEIPLNGVLHGELQDYLKRHISRFLVDPVIEAYPLIRVGVLGEVDRPGYYFLVPDQQVTDAIMLAGGPTREADLTKTIVRRGPAVLWERDRLREAVIGGTMLEQLGLRSGDEVVVGERTRRWETVLRTAGYLSGIFLSIYGATQIAK